MGKGIAVFGVWLDLEMRYFKDMRRSPVRNGACLFSWLIVPALHRFPFLLVPFYNR